MHVIQTTQSSLFIDTTSAKLSLNTSKNSFDSKELYSPLIFAKKVTNFDTCSLGNSLCDLEAPSSALLNRRDSYMNSIASTNDGSRFCLEGKTFTRGTSLEPEAVGHEDEKRRLSLSPEKHSGGQVFDYGDTCPEILENSEEEALNQSLDLSDDLLNESQDLCALVNGPVKMIPKCQNVCPVFSNEGANATQYNFANGDRTVEYKLNTKYTALYGTQALPSTGKSTFSVKIDHCRKEHARLYVGVAASNLKGQPMGYKPGFYFISAFSRESYLNGMRIVEQEDLPEEGEVITVTIDMDKALISFESDKGAIVEGRMILPKGKINEFYPCVALGEAGGRVSFV